jgi:hypothetical protein
MTRLTSLLVPVILVSLLEINAVVMAEGHSASESRMPYTLTSFPDYY